MKLEYEKIDSKHIRFKNNPFKINIMLLPILAIFLVLTALICLLLVFTGNILFIVCTLIGAYGTGNLGINYFKIYKDVKKKG